jgi:hypothetical protein
LEKKIRKIYSLNGQVVSEYQEALKGILNIGNISFKMF